MLGIKSLLHLTTPDASTILLLYFPPYSSFRILNFPLPLCTISASNLVPSISTKHQHEYSSSSNLRAYNFSYPILNLFKVLLVVVFRLRVFLLGQTYFLSSAILLYCTNKNTYNFHAWISKMEFVYLLFNMYII